MAVDVPFHTFILKVASRCNLNCTYCFVYNRGDERWRLQPRLMSEGVARLTVQRIREHCQANGKDDVSIVFHGGEPLLGGVAHLRMLTRVIEEELAGTGIHPSLGMQSNGLLFSEEIGDFCLEKRISMGVSLDGPPELNDLHRVDHAGRPTSERLEEKLRLLGSPKYRPIFDGLLAVVNVEGDPVRIFDYLASFRPPEIDFLLPYDHYERFPPAKTDFESTRYGEWLIRLFDHWFYGQSGVRIREFESIMRQILDANSLVESIGTGPVDLIVVETNGDIEAVDSLKASFEGATALGYSIYEHDFDTVARHAAVVARHVGADALCATCRECDLVEICGGGYLPNRYSRDNGFSNPSVFCRDLDALIRHIHGRMVDTLEREGVLHAEPAGAES